MKPMVAGEIEEPQCTLTTLGVCGKKVLQPDNPEDMANTRNVGLNCTCGARLVLKFFGTGKTDFDLAIVNLVPAVRLAESVPAEPWLGGACWCGHTESQHPTVGAHRHCARCPCTNFEPPVVVEPET